MGCVNPFDEAFEEFVKKIKQGLAEESYNMDHVYAWKKLIYHSTNCKYFKKCIFGHQCLIHGAWSIEICNAVMNLLSYGLVKISKNNR